MEVRVGKKLAQKEKVKGQQAKTLTVVECWLTQGEEADEKQEAIILWTERPTGTVMGAGRSLWSGARGKV